MAKLEPVGNRVIVKPVQSNEKTAGGLYIPDGANQKDSQGEVVAVGTLKDVSVKVGDIIIYAEFGGTSIDVDGQQFVIVKGDDILAVMR